ncbi:MAG: hypothetical protein KOO60_12955 [Gemmatimonadales bacterium]|nr:hypothetical protein [Gemmatimonadales bacterium]
MLRGGSWSCEAWACRSGVRHFGSPDNGSHNHGFRIVRLAD